VHCQKALSAPAEIAIPKASFHSPDISERLLAVLNVAYLCQQNFLLIALRY
jgi:hypothetical protein